MAKPLELEDMGMLSSSISQQWQEVRSEYEVRMQQAMSEQRNDAESGMENYGK